MSYVEISKIENKINIQINKFKMNVCLILWYAFYFFLAWINYKFIGNSVVGNLLVVTFSVLVLVGLVTTNKFSKEFSDMNSAIEYLRSLDK